MNYPLENESRGVKVNEGVRNNIRYAYEMILIATAVYDLNYLF